eukprot:Gregarina_sp_Poly_1__1686@NODE_1432_length_4160_cov_258_183728_g950_i0_p5_GENE_NODE_1432_length_4160_cov_258_183728_g950_i0NODE_1432_length_4160_cov_258_183728_g950_i0_p5_ORF_typecomplete_len149_score26_56_NODE_1432_length_4160_cov_258_183728_g950_i026563102
MRLDFQKQIQEVDHRQAFATASLPSKQRDGHLHEHQHHGPGAIRKTPEGFLEIVETLPVSSAEETVADAAFEGRRVSNAKANKQTDDHIHQHSCPGAVRKTSEGFLEVVETLPVSPAEHPIFPAETGVGTSRAKAKRKSKFAEEFMSK